MSTSFLVVCPNCSAVNRVPAPRLGDAPVCGVCKQNLFAGTALELTGENLERHILRNEIPLVVDFWAPWCGPCRMMAPAFAEAARRLEPGYRLAKLDTEAHPSAGSRYGIRSIPTLVLFHGGREVARQSGAMDATSLVRWIQTHAPH